MKESSAPAWSADSILNLGRSYQGAAVLAAAADLDVFGVLAPGPATASQVAQTLGADLRGVTILLDALAALGLLGKAGDRYALADGVEEFLTADGRRSVLAMSQHQANCLRRWAQLAHVVKTGRPAPPLASVRGEAGDQKAFIGAMHNISAPIASEVIQAVQPLAFTHLLDLGGGSGTWTMAFLRAVPTARATLFDLPQVIPMARRRLAGEGFADRVQLVPGDFMQDDLPAGADLVWVSAIVHQNSRAQNRILLGKIYRALVPGGRIAIRDIVMDPARTQPVAGALFAVNMLVATEGGGTFTFEELREDLEAAGFSGALLQRRDEGMHSIVAARK